MDGEAGTADDQGSGWFEVRKKHRISSKLSIQKVSGGSSNKGQSWNYLPSRNAKIVKFPTVQHAESSKVRTGLNPDSNVSVNTSGLSSPAAVETLVCLDKLVGGQHIHHLLKSTDSTVASNATTEVLLQEKLDEIPKIKWGDIEDVSFTVSVPGDSGKTRDDAENAHIPSCDEQKQQDLVLGSKSVVLALSSTDVLEENAKSENFEQFCDLMLSSDAPEESFSGTWREVSEVSSEYKNVIETESKENLKEIHGVTDEQNEEQNEAPNDFISEDLVVGSPSLASLVGGVIEMTAEESPDKSVGRNMSFSEESVVNEIAVARTSSHNLLESISDGVKVSSDVPTANGDVLMDEPDQGEDEQSEGKERFRERLWCFLFENLNRAVDELYLLCELECDIEQMNEAVLVLEEAISDFGELKCRVDHFEGTKRFASQSSKDVTGASLKTDHRRPHALSWEVRRMTTSPHRAEILSSSLEAFRKIQSERASKHIVHDGKDPIFPPSTIHTCSENSPGADDNHSDDQRQTTGSEGRRRVDAIHGSSIKDKTHLGVSFHSRSCSAQAGLLTSEKLLVSSSGKGKKEPLEPISEFEKQASRKDKLLADNGIEKQSNVSDIIKRNNSQCIKEKEKDKKNTAPWKTMDAWKEKRNWEDILKSPLRSSSRVSCSPGVGRKNVERARVLHDKLMSPEKKKKSALDTRREAEERHARAMRIRGQLENERLQRLQRVSEKLNRVNEWQAVRSLKLREGLNARQQRGETRHEAYIAQVVRRAGDESSKVNEVRFITSLNEENKKLILRQKLQDSELRRAEKMQTIRIKQKEDTAREEAAMERRKLLEAEKMQRLAETQRKKEEAQLRREEERKASSAAREAKAAEHLRRKEIRAKAQQEEAELLAQKLAEKLSESELRRKFYLEQIREKASTDFRDQSSPLVRRSLNREGPSRHLQTNGEDNQTSCVPVIGNSASGVPYPTKQQSLKRRIKRIRQRLMALKHEFIEPPFVAENSGLGCRTLLGTARVKIGKWLKELQRLCQARKEGAASIGLIVGDMLKFLEGKDIELHASRQAGLLDFISSALPASHTSKPESCQATVYFLRLLRVLLSVPANRAYFLALNLLPPIIPMLSASLDNYIKVAASSNHGTNNLANKTPTDNMDTVTEVLDSFLFTVTAIMGYTTNDERELQMQDDLLELIVSYQAIHRLRDLFALYDRPQVEGSPFPSSIILSLNLLSVLTSRPGSISSINWQAGISKSTTEKENEISEIVDYNDVVDKFVMNDASGDGKSSQLATLPQPSETIPASEFTQMVMNRVQPAGVFLADMPEPPLGKERSDFSLESNREEVTSVAYELYIGSQKSNSEELAKSPLDQEDQKITKDSQACRKRNDELPCNSERNKEATSKQPVAFFLSAMAETGLVSLTSLLTAVLLHANSRLSSDMASYVLPSNFEEVAIGVLRVLNNLACLDISLLQKMLARSDLRMEFFHLMSFLLSHCTSRWKSANDKVSFLLLESLLLLGYFSLFHSGNQAVLRWGKPPTILHKICDLPFVFFSDPELTPILAGTFVAACYGCEQNKGVIQQELSIEMLLNLLRSCRHSLLTYHFDSSPPDSNTTNSSSDSISSAPEAKRIHGDSSSRPNRKGGQTLSTRGATAGTRAMKSRVQRDNKRAKTCDEWAFMHNLPTSDASSAFMLHRRFPTCFLDKAEEFFAAGNLDPPA